MQMEEEEQFEALLDYLQRSRGFDFHSYKRASLMRRVCNRMQLIKIKDYQDFLDYLEVHPEEFTQLFNTILINVTSFFRDDDAWDYLAQAIFPRFLADQAKDAPIRVWSVGCASGEEVYTLAILLAEVLGMDAFNQRVKIYATDVDEDALNHARQASYREKDLQPIPADLRAKYFVQAPVLSTGEDRYVFRADLRRSIIFGRHDLLQDAPISRLNLLVCRNTLMYFNAEAQGKILSRFHFALKDDGVLFLGKAETLLTHTSLFTPLAVKHHIFAKTSRLNLRDRPLTLAQRGDREAMNHPGNHAHLRDMAFDASQTAQIVLDANGNLLQGDDGAILGIGLTFEDVTSRQQLRMELLHSHHELETIKEEIQTTHEELEAANEELQSTNEELETTNEELQSTNEELETMNEELQSTNEELETLNTELNQRTDEVNRINAFLRSILSGLQSALIVVDDQLNVLLWNRRSEDLWGLRSDEVQGCSLLKLDIGLPVEALPLQAFLAGECNYQELTVTATNRRGKIFQCHVTCTPFLHSVEEQQGVVLLMEENRGAE